EGLLTERITLDWPAPDAAAEAAATRSAAKLVLNLGLMAVESLPRGGAVRVRLSPASAALGIAVTASGQGAKIPDDMRPALAEGANVAALVARAIPAYLAVRLAAANGGRVAVTGTATDRVDFSVELPIRR